ncbi:MAG: hypothetical protein PUA96_09805 [Bacteroidales bacterium]|nr:hypothetical protein [Bacteroidales bacterium]
MKLRLTSIAMAALFCASCFPTRIVTVSSVHDTPSYSTVVTAPKTHVSTTTTQVYATEPDISLYLDLQAVAAAFAQSSSIREFESLLNNSSYMISNLDLNRDGYVDYLRVMSAMQGYNHVFVIQAVLAPNIYQDVATVVAEVPAFGNYYVEVIGSSYIYGPNYIIRPVYYTRPVIFNHICRHDYSPWKSPWYWNHYPTYYKHPAPVHVNHYHAYVNTFMKNHRYCHEVQYYSHCHYPDYQRLCTIFSRDDYGKQYPERSFTVRNANVAVQNSAVERAENARKQANAYDVRVAYDATKRTTTSSATRGTASSGSASSSSATRGNSGSSATRGSAASSSSSATRGASNSGSSASRNASGTASSGSSASRGAASSGSSSSGRTTGSSGSASRSTGSSSSAASSSGSSSATRTTGTSVTRSSTTSSRVQSSGSSSTKTSTTNATGSQSTVRRGSTGSSSSSARSSGSSATRSTGTSATRSSSTSSSTRTGATRR